MTLDLRLRSNAASGSDTYVLASDFADPVSTTLWDASGIYLMDPVTGRQLKPLVRDDACVCSSGLSDVELVPGGTTTLTSAFPAPSADASTADVVVPHFGAFRDVPLR